MKRADADLLRTLKERLVQSERHIVAAERIVHRQRELVLHLQHVAQDHDASALAAALLEEFEHWQQLHLVDHARLESLIKSLEGGLTTRDRGA